jgi:D-beta-D-heptose 7-phosphate kinase/D-beta-D-heptose 1-phosphate adenosyltransferase
MQTESQAARLSSRVRAFATRRVLVIGDLMLDEFIWGKVSRISPEAPVPVVNVTGESYYPGGAANVARNVREFTSGIAVMGILGDDAPGRRLLALLDASGIDTSAVQKVPGASTTVKTRIIARNQQVVRVDRESTAALTAAQTELAMNSLEGMIGNLDAVIVADYGKGFLTQPLADRICRTARAHGKVLTVDPHPHTSLAWIGATAVKPNRQEAFIAAGLPISDPVVPVMSDRPLIEAGERLLQRWEAKSVLITLGEHGMLLFTKGAPAYHTPTRAKDVFDVSGAGDTAIAVFTLGLSAGVTALEAAELANRASGIVVGKLGTATVGPEELVAGLAGT